MMAQLSTPAAEVEKTAEAVHGEGDVKEQFLNGLKKAGLDVAA